MEREKRLSRFSYVPSESFTPRRGLESGPCTPQKHQGKERRRRARSDGDEEEMLRAALSSFLFERENRQRHPIQLISALSRAANKATPLGGVKRVFSFSKPVKARAKRKGKEREKRGKKPLFEHTFPSCSRHPNQLNLAVRSKAYNTNTVRGSEAKDLGFIRLNARAKRKGKEREK